MRQVLFLFLIVAALAGCTAETAQSTAGLGKLEINPSIDSIFVNNSVQFRVMDTETGEAVEGAWWGIASLHNVPGDRGAIRSEGRYTAPRLAPDPPTVRIEARTQGRRVQSEFMVVNPDWPPEGTPRPGDSHMHPVYGAPPKVRTSKPIDAGLRVEESVRITAFDMTGRPLLVSHYEIRQNNRVVDYAGTITNDGVYTAPSDVPDPPRVQVHILYFREGGMPGHLALVGYGIKILP